jgi:hypothetical protein
LYCKKNLADADHLTNFDPPLYNVRKQQGKTMESSHPGNMKICFMEGWDTQGIDLLMVIHKSWIGKRLFLLDENH